MEFESQDDRPARMTASGFGQVETLSFVFALQVVKHGVERAIVSHSPVSGT